MIETLGERESIGCTVVIEEHCTTTRYIWDEVDGGGSDPLTAIAERYVLRTPCPSKDWPVRTRLDRILQFARDWWVDGAIVLQQKFCDPHEADILFVPFVDSFRTFISTPTGEVRETLEAIQCFVLP